MQTAARYVYFLCTHASRPDYVRFIGMNHGGKIVVRLRFKAMLRFLLRGGEEMPSRAAALEICDSCVIPTNVTAWSIEVASPSSDYVQGYITATKWTRVEAIGWHRSLEGLTSDIEYNALVPDTLQSELTRLVTVHYLLTHCSHHEQEALALFHDQVCDTYGTVHIPADFRRIFAVAQKKLFQGKCLQDRDAAMHMACKYIRKLLTQCFTEELHVATTELEHCLLAIHDELRGETSVVLETQVYPSSPIFYHREKTFRTISHGEISR